MALFELFNKKVDLEVVGTRPGEKLEETLVGAEEMVRTMDCDKYFVIHPWTVQVKQGKQKHPFTSGTTTLLTINQTKEKLLTMDFVREALDV